MSAAALIPTGRVRPRRMSWSGTLPVPAPSHPVPSRPAPSRPAAMPPPLAGSGWRRDAPTLRRLLAALAAL